MADKVKIIFKSGQTNSPAQQTNGAYTVPLSDGQVLFYYNKDASTGDVYSAGEIYYDKLVDGTVKRMKMGAIADRATYDKSGTDIEDYVFNLNFTVGTNNIVITPVSGAGKNKAAVTIPGATAALAGVVTTGAQSFAGAKTFNGVVHVNNATAVALNNAHGLAVGALGSTNLGFDGAHIQARNNGAASTLNLNSLGGQVVIGSGGLKVDGPATFTKAITDKNGKELLADLFVNRLVGALSNSDYKINWYNTANARMSTDLTQLIIPAATASAAGLVSILDQIFKGNKTFSDNITANANIYVDTSGKGLWLKDSTNTRYGAVVDSANNLWIGSSTCGDRAHVGQLFLSTGFQDSSLSSAYPTVLISKPKKNADGTFDHDKYYVIHSGNFVEYDQYVKDIQWINGTTLGPKAKLIYKLNGVTQETTTTIPAATAALAGVVTTGAQSFAGAKTFTSNTTISGTLTMGNNIIFPGAYGVYWNGAQKFKIVAKYGTSSTTGYLCIQGTSSLADYIRIREDGQVQILNSANTELLDKNSQILRANLFLAKLELATTGTTNVITAKNTANGVLSTITLNGATTGAAGLVTNGAQTWSGEKTLTSNLKLTTGNFFLNRKAGTTYGRISFWDPSYTTWYLYMNDGTASPTGVKSSTFGTVTSWALRSLIENSATYGWIWESCPNGSDVTKSIPVAQMALNANTGNLYLRGEYIDKNNETIRANLFVSTLQRGTSNKSGTAYVLGTNCVIQGKNTKGSIITEFTLPNADANNAGVITNGAQTIAGTKTFTGSLILSNEADVSVPSNTAVALRIGNINGTHIAFDGNEIQAKATGTTASTLNFNLEGGTVVVGTGGFTVNGGTTTLGGILTGKSTASFSGRVTASDFQWTSPKTINQTAFDGTSNIITNAWGTQRNLTIGYKTLGVNGTTAYSWDLLGIIMSSIIIGPTTSWELKDTGLYRVASSEIFTGASNPEATNGGLAPYRYGQMIVLNTTSHGMTQIYIPHAFKGYGIKIRSGWNGTYNNYWTSILDSDNYTNYTVKKDGTGATGTWQVNITGNAGSSNWSKYALGLESTRYTNTNIETFVQTVNNVHPYGRNNEVRFTRFYNDPVATYKSPVVDAHYLMMSIDNAIAYTRIMAFDIRTNDIYAGGRINNTWQNWDKILSSANYTQYTVNKSGSGATGTWPISITGNAGSATKLQIARTINGTTFDGTQNIVTAYSYNLTFGSTGNNESWFAFASMPSTNPSGNYNATFIIADCGNFGGTITGAWICKISNRASTATFEAVELVHPNSGVVEFGHYVSGSNFVYGVHTGTFHGTIGITILQNQGVNFGIILNNATTAPSGWVKHNTVFSLDTKNYMNYAVTLSTAQTITGAKVFAGAFTIKNNNMYPTFDILPTQTNNTGKISRIQIEGSCYDNVGLWVYTDSTTTAKSRRGLVLYGYAGQSGEANALALRQCDSNGTWIADRYILHSGNYTNYTVTKTGGGATGTWPISISGNAATATKLLNTRNIHGVGFNGTADIVLPTIRNYYFNIGATVNYVYLGTLTTAQEGVFTRLSVFCGYGYNANIDQERVFDIDFRTSNNNSNQNGLYYAAIVRIYSYNSQHIYIRQISNTSYAFYMSTIQYTGRAILSINSHSSTSFSFSGTGVSALPSGCNLVQKSFIGSFGTQHTSNTDGSWTSTSDYYASRVFYGSHEPKNGRTGDIWLKPAT